MVMKTFGTVTRLMTLTIRLVTYGLKSKDRERSSGGKTVC